MNTKNPRTILITGCSSGIGLAAAHGLKKRGWRVIATARNAGVVESLRAQGFLSVQLDLESNESITMALSWIDRQTPRIDALFNNAGFAVPGALEDLSREALFQQFDASLFGAHELTTRIIKRMREQGGGRIVQNCSILGLVSIPYFGAYCALKHAIEGLSTALRAELEGSGITVSVLEPGPVKSNFESAALARFNAWIDLGESVHRDNYLRWVRNRNLSPKSPYGMEPARVVEALLYALETPRPKARYFVGAEAKAVAWLRRLLPLTTFESLAAKFSKRQFLEKNSR